MSENKTDTTGADAIDVAIASGLDFDGTAIPATKLDLYHKVMGLEAGRQRSGVSNTMRSRIVRASYLIRSESSVVVRYVLAMMHSFGSERHYEDIFWSSVDRNERWNNPCQVKMIS